MPCPRYLLLVALLVGCNSPPPTTVNVAAASNLTEAIREITARFTAQSGLPTAVNLSSTGQLTQQIEQGAPVDLFLAADTASVELLRAKQRVVVGTDAIYARGQLAIWSKTMPVSTLTALTDSQVKKLAIANPEHAPYGAAARQALQAAGVWPPLESKLVVAENVRQALQFAEAGADIALVPYALARRAGGHLALVPGELHAPLDQALAVIAGSAQPEGAARLRAFILSGAGRQILREHGYLIPGD